MTSTLSQNWRGDVSALVYSNGDQVEQVRYSPYGTPFGIPGGDCDSDGDCDYGDTADSDQIQAWINATAYDVRGDLDLDGDVDAGDKSLLLGALSGIATGLGIASSSSNSRVYSGSLGLSGVGLLSSRNRMLAEGLGRWQSRDPYEYHDSMSQYTYAMSGPIVHVDPYGLLSQSPTTGDGYKKCTCKGKLIWTDEMLGWFVFENGQGCPPELNPNPLKCDPPSDCTVGIRIKIGFGDQANPETVDKWKVDNDGNPSDKLTDEYLGWHGPFDLPGTGPYWTGELGAQDNTSEADFYKTFHCGDGGGVFMEQVISHQAVPDKGRSPGAPAQISISFLVKLECPCGSL